MMIRKNLIRTVIIIALSHYIFSSYGMEQDGQKNLSGLFNCVVSTINPGWHNPNDEKAENNITYIIGEFKAFDLRYENMKKHWDGAEDKSTVLPTILSRSLRTVDKARNPLLNLLSYVDIVSLLAVMAQSTDAKIISYHPEGNTYKGSVPANDQSWKSAFALPVNEEYASLPSMFMTLLSEADKLKPIADRGGNLPGRSDFPGRAAFLSGYKKLHDVMGQLSRPDDYNHPCEHWLGEEGIVYIKVFHEIISNAIHENKINKDWLSENYPQIYDEGHNLLGYFQSRKLMCGNILNLLEKDFPDNSYIQEAKEKLEEIQPVEEKHEGDDPFKEILSDLSWSHSLRSSSRNPSLREEKPIDLENICEIYRSSKEVYRKALQHAWPEGQIDKIWLYWQLPMELHIRSVIYTRHKAPITTY